MQLQCAESCTQCYQARPHDAEHLSSSMYGIRRYSHYKTLKVMGNALNIENYFWWRDDCFGLLIHQDALFHFMVSISDEYKYKRLVKTTFKSCGKLIFLELYHTRN